MFAVVWIIIYCALTVPIRGELGDESIQMLAALAVISVCMGIFIKQNRLEEKYGLSFWPKDTKRFLYFIPLWVLVTGNLWDGLEMSYKGSAQVFAVISMLLIGYAEEILRQRGKL